MAEGKIFKRKPQICTQRPSMSWWWFLSLVCPLLTEYSERSEIVQPINAEPVDTAAAGQYPTSGVSACDWLPQTHGCLHRTRTANKVSAGIDQSLIHIVRQSAFVTAVVWYFDISCQLVKIFAAQVYWTWSFPTSRMQLQIQTLNEWTMLILSNCVHKL